MQHTLSKGCPMSYYYYDASNTLPLHIQHPLKQQIRKDYVLVNFSFYYIFLIHTVVSSLYVYNLYRKYVCVCVCMVYVSVLYLCHVTLDVC